LEIDIAKNNEIKYQTADNLAVLPVNDDAIVEAVAKALNYNLNAVFRLKPASGYEMKQASLFPNPCSVRDFLARYCDLTSAPRRADLKLLAAYASDATDKKALIRLSSKEAKDEYRDKVLEAHVGFADVITRLCPSVRMPLEHFIALCPRLQPRYYTISSSSSAHPKSIHITVSVLKTERKDGGIFNGVCSNHLADTAVNQTIRVFSRDSSFTANPT